MSIDWHIIIFGCESCHDFVDQFENGSVGCKLDTDEHNSEVIPMALHADV